MSEGGNKLSQQRTPETNSYPKTKKANQEFFLSFFLTWLHTLVAQAIHVGSSVGSLRGSMENRTPLKARVHSPAPCLLTPNDDDRERAQVRLARAAALRRKSGLAPDVEERLSTMRQQESNVLSKERILELHNNCIKLAAENKITQRNTWDLKLIDHLSTLVEGDDEDEDQTNFQKVGAIYYIPPERTPCPLRSRL
jgi:hypothetical protein